MKEKNNSNLSKVIKEQIMAIRDSGETNMFAKNNVQRIANERNFFELVCFIDDHPDRYSKFILSGDENLLNT